MLVICEDCSKKYNIDETKIKGERARFSCQECGHIIVVQNPQLLDKKENSNEEAPPQEQKNTMSELESSQAEVNANAQNPVSDKKTNKTSHATKKGKGASIRFYLVFALIMGFVSIAAAFAFLYVRYIPQLMNEQVDLRTSAIASIFSGSVAKPVLVHNYLQINKEAERVSTLPGVAYATVVNKRGIAVAGFFNDLSRFDQVFAAQVKTAGFPRSIVEKNKLEKGQKEKTVRFAIGGQKILDRGILLPDTGATVHVGIYLSDIDKAIKQALISPFTLSLLGGLLLLGLITFLRIGKSISTPLIELTDVVNRISLGELELSVEPKGPSEVRELAAAYERMRYSIKAAMKRLQNAH